MAEINKINVGGEDYDIRDSNSRVYTTLVPYGTAIPANANLNTTTYLKVGNYYCSADVTVATLSNRPTDSAFMMQVYSPLSTTIDNETTGTWVYRIRKLLTYTGHEYIQKVSSGGTKGTFSYGAWEKIIKSTDTASTSAAGVMSTTDKTKLDGIATGATKVTTDTVSGWGYTKNAGTVTSVRVKATSPVVSSTSTAQTSTLNTTISLADNYGDTKNPYASKTKNYVLAAPNGSNGAPTFRALVAADIPGLAASKITSGTFDAARLPSDLTNAAAWLDNNIRLLSLDSENNEMVFNSYGASSEPVIAISCGDYYNTAGAYYYTFPSKSCTLASTTDIPKITRKYQHNITYSYVDAVNTGEIITVTFSLINNYSSAYTSAHSASQAVYQAGFSSSTKLLNASGFVNFPSGIQLNTASNVTYKATIYSAPVYGVYSALSGGNGFYCYYISPKSQNSTTKNLPISGGSTASVSVTDVVIKLTA